MSKARVSRTAGARRSIVAARIGFETEFVTVVEAIVDVVDGSTGPAA